MKAKKSLGQNFLIDDRVVDSIIEAGEISQDDNVLEIGPGRGFLTKELIQKSGRVLAIEKDESLAELCRKKLASGNLEVITGDVLETNWEEILSQRGFSGITRLSKVRGKTEQRKGVYSGINGMSSRGFDKEICQTRNSRYKLIANIPYYITGKILRLFLENSFQPQILVLMVQKEVAERICQKPGKLGILSLSVQYFGEPGIVEIVPREKFDPIPDVDSAVLKIVVKNENRLDLEAEKKFFRLIKKGFANPRKTLVNNLSAGLVLEKEAVEKVLEKIGFDGNARAQELGVEDWIKMIEYL
ncbi:MAG: 16S rRNA (adenine(1518)-N(6)/adenine(1519)-N(6))-dimethyltransferase [Candidatus Moranbacteria bacterium]|nr:16S rRNA (adenine(1518)-N(6)/adenine(1519)-N(6))-dimethyltransferase [Candidatus Moranbacteria bacterium]